MIPKTILITGASGLIGTRLSELLREKGYRVRLLGRSKKGGDVPSFVWNIHDGVIDESAIQGVDGIIHLAGAGIADKPWTENRKKEILESRTKSTALLSNALKKGNHQLKAFVSASAIGYYGFDGGDNVLTEESAPGSDFLAEVVKRWENEIDQIRTLGIRTIKIRIGIVLSEKGGALKEIAKPVRWGVGAPLGSGSQNMSWIHIDDLCRMFIHALEQEQMQGAYNGVSPAWTTNREMTSSIAKILHRPMWLPPVPSFVLKLMLGEMANLVLSGSKVSADKIVKTGFTFQFNTLEAALKNLLSAGK